MQRWLGRVALVTGASSGIGAAIAGDLVRHGMQVVGFARREDKVKEIAGQLKNASGKLYAFKGDVSKEEDVLSAFAWAKQLVGGVDVLINNAGILNLGNISEGQLEEWRPMFDVNVLGLSLCTREAINNMRDRGVDDGHIINICSTGSSNSMSRRGFSMYDATKSAVRALTDSMKKELVTMGSRIRVTSICPEMVSTDLFYPKKSETEQRTICEDHLLPEDIVSAVVYALSAPQRVQIQDIVLKPTGAAY